MIKADAAPARADRSADFASALALPSVLFWLAPATMLFGNRGEYGDVAPIFGALLGLVGASTAALFLLLRATRGLSLAHRVLSGGLVGLALGAWVQSQLLVWDFGPLDGRGLPWAAFAVQARVELLVWALIVVLCEVLAVMRPLVLTMVARSVIVVGLLSFGISALSATVSDPSGGRHVTASEALAFHPKNNVVILILDTYQADAFQEILDRYPHEVRFLDGFTHYPDTVSGYPTTKHSLPLLLTGKYYRNEFAYDKTGRAKLFEGWLGDYYKARGYGVVVHGNSVLLGPAVEAYRVYFGWSSEQARAVDVGLFRALPIVLKRHVYDEGRWFLARLRLDRDSPPRPHAADWRFLRAFESSAHVGSGKTGEFKFIHLVGAHYPLSLNENYEYVPDIPETREGYLNQARGVLKLTERVLARLKALGVYDDAEILIVADHGSHNLPPGDMRGDPTLAEVPATHIGGARPLFLHKRSGSTGPLKTSDIGMHLAYVHCMLTRTARQDCEDLEAAQRGQRPVRPHYRYSWSGDAWWRDYSPDMTRYEVHGDAREFGSWSNTMMVYSETGVRQANRYEPGTWIRFGQGGESERYLLYGWSHEEAEYRWTDGPVAGLKLALATPLQADLLLAVEAAGYPPVGASVQVVDVFVNGARVGNWSLKDASLLETRIPASLVQGKEVNIRFAPQHPAAPCEGGASGDCRLLGLAVFRLNIRPA